MSNFKNYTIKRKRKERLEIAFTLMGMVAVMVAIYVMMWGMCALSTNCYIANI